VSHLPHWLSRPAVLLSTLAGLAGSGLIFWAAATGDYWWAVWGAVSFVGAGLLWYLGDLAATSAGGAH